MPKSKDKVIDKGGRPKKYTDEEVMQQKIDQYFSTCDKDKRPYTISGLSLALDMTRMSLINYEKDDRFFDTIKKAKAKCENFVEERLFSGQVVAGVIFNLKNNYEGWKDKQETDVTSKGERIETNTIVFTDFKK